MTVHMPVVRRRAPVVTDTVTIHRLGADDVPLLLRAQAAMPDEMGPDRMTPATLIKALSDRELDGLVLTGPGRVMLIGWQVVPPGELAVIGGLYREGTTKGFLTDCRRLSERMDGVLREFGVKRAALSVSARNPRIDRLLKLYGRFGFVATSVRAGKVL